MHSGAHLDAGDTDWVTQRLSIDYTPDDPVTFLNEEVVAVTVAGETFTYQADQAPTTTDPDDDLSLPLPLAIGFIASSATRNYAFPGAPPGGIDVGTEIEARVQLHTIEDAGPVQTDHSHFSRQNHCPAL